MSQPPKSSIDAKVLEGLSEHSRACIQRLSQHESETVDLLAHPVSKLAAVLVLLYERAGGLRVLLTTRSKSLRSHPGQTALPGGKVDDTDGDAWETAYREANEEVGLPLHSPHVHALCALRPFVSAYRLLVTPVVVFLDDSSVLDALVASPGEVEHIFDHPLEAMLDPALSTKEPLEPIGSAHWPYEVELHNWTDIKIPWLNDTTYRMHRFRSTASPVKGLTADILIATAQVAYDREPVYDRWASDQFTHFSLIQPWMESTQDALYLASSTAPAAPVTAIA